MDDPVLEHQGMTNRWDADRDLSPGIVVRVLRSQFGDLALDSIEYLGSGWDYDAYLVDNAVVFRFPRRAEVAEGLQREEAILDFIASRLCAVTTIPRIEFHGTESPDFPYRFFGHRAIPGVAADRSSAGPTRGLARDLGRFLTALHSLRTADVAGFLPDEDEGCADRLAEVEALLGAGHAVEDHAAHACAWIRAGPAVPPAATEPCVIHNDFCPDHMLVGRASGRLEGVIDWSDAALGDPALDFVQLVLWGGWPFLDEVVAGYENELDEAFPQRLALLARVLSLKWLADALDRHGDVQKHLRWLAHAFAPRQTMDAP